jgi:hypothetical protein
MNNYSIDLALRPTTFDLWHVCLAGTVAVLTLTLIVVLISVLLAGRRCRKAGKSQPVTAAVTH